MERLLSQENLLSSLRKAKSVRVCFSGANDLHWIKVTKSAARELINTVHDDAPEIEATLEYGTLWISRYFGRF